ncbi:cytolytic toxin-alpha-like isoform X2 [Megalobrama amblycephala]|uniref:cytolytic toxin-alpha-like isoform X2 n=1 Tax=Megalobrama amblycephala TaxID=75352 RepID=UPI0020146A85|nr:cytolytic toxin-alpha-like isoform X2 [Megalobrama amblycephala]
MGEKARPDEAPSPALSLLSVKSDQSMDQPIAFSNKTPNYIGPRPAEAPSPATSYFSLKSNQSMDQPIAFKDRSQPYSVKRLRKDEAPSPSPSLLSVKSDQSMDRRIVFNSGAQICMGENLKPDEATSPAPSLTSLKTEHSVDRPIGFRQEAQNYRDRSTLSATLLTEDHYRCSVCTEIFKDPVSIPCGHSYCKHCIEIYWSKPTQAGGYACPQCRKRFRDRPVLSVNVVLSKLIEELQKAGFSPALPAHCYAGPEDVPCDICAEMKLKAVKSCLTCTASYCETHVRQHYTVPALQRHNLVEAIMSIPDSKDIKEIKELQDGVIEEISMDEKAENFHPTKCFYSGFSCNDLPMDVTEIVALGRPLDLGMLYDCRNDLFTSDGNLWDKHTVTRNRISWPQLKTHVKVLEDDSLQERCKAFEMSPMLRVSALCGLMELHGAAAFLNHPVQSQYQERFTLHYKTTTRLDMISQRLLQEGAPTSAINATTATHVIIAVFYGAQAFFVFDKERISTERNTEMENVIKKLTTTLRARDVFTSLNETEKANSILYDCSLYIDVGDWKSPVTFDKAMEIYGSLPTLLGSKGERAVPLKVWLYPLKKLDKSSVSAALSGVSENVMHQAENILEHLKKHIRICQDMITDYYNLTVITRFPALEEKLQNFSEFLQEYMTEFQRKAAEIIESINVKEGDRQKSFQDLISYCNQSPFNPDHTHQWLEKKKNDLLVLNECRAVNMTIVKSQEELQRVINDPQMNHVFCFTISSMEAEDYFLKDLKQHIKLMKKCTLTTYDSIKLEIHCSQ